MLARMKDLIMPDRTVGNLGKLKMSDYALVSEILKESQLIDRTPRYDDFYRGPK